MGSTQGAFRRRYLQVYKAAGSAQVNSAECYCGLRENVTDSCCLCCQPPCFSAPAIFMMFGWMCGIIRDMCQRNGGLAVKNNVPSSKSPGFIKIATRCNEREVASGSQRDSHELESCHCLVASLLFVLLLEHQSAFDLET